MIFNMDKAKIPYFIMLLLVGTYATYLFRNGFLIIDLIICIGVSFYTILKPDTFCIFAKEDKYSFISAFPAYSLALVLGPLGIIFWNLMKITSINFVTGASITILLFLFLVIIDRSRYN